MWPFLQSLCSHAPVEISVKTLHPAVPLWAKLAWSIVLLGRAANCPRLCICIWRTPLQHGRICFLPYPIKGKTKPKKNKTLSKTTLTNAPLKRPEFGRVTSNTSRNNCSWNFSAANSCSHILQHLAWLQFPQSYGEVWVACSLPTVLGSEFILHLFWSSWCWRMALVRHGLMEWGSLKSSPISWSWSFFHRAVNVSVRLTEKASLGLNFWLKTVRQRKVKL